MRIYLKQKDALYKPLLYHCENLTKLTNKINIRVT